MEKTTWEPASALPKSLVEEFEHGLIGVEHTITDTTFGVVNHTLFVDVVSATDESPTKKHKAASPHVTQGNNMT